MTTKHDFAFYQNSSAPRSFQTGITMGGADITSGISGVSDFSFASNAVNVEDKSNVQKHIEIVEYLKKLPQGIRATNIDISRELGINLEHEYQVFGMVKNNPKIDFETSKDGVYSLQYRAKFIIHNQRELLQIINRVANGILLSDVINCYDGIESDVNSLIVGGAIIANKNKDLKSLVLYPRGRAFITKLSGTVKATQGQQNIVTSTSLLKEIRRGEAIQVDDNWYRISSAIGSGAANQQNQRSTAPTSVSSDHDMSDRNVYCDVYTATSLPLDGDFEGSAAGLQAHESALTIASTTSAATANDNTTTLSSASNSAGSEAGVYTYKGSVYRHGCTNDIKASWHHTIDSGLKRFLGDEIGLAAELVTLGLLSQNSLRQSTGPKKITKETAVKKRKPSKRRVTAVTTNYGVNAHLRGTAVERILLETRKKEEAAAAAGKR